MVRDFFWEKKERSSSDGGEREKYENSPKWLKLIFFLHCQWQIAFYVIFYALTLSVSLATPQKMIIVEPRQRKSTERK